MGGFCGRPVVAAFAATVIALCAAAAASAGTVVLRDDAGREIRFDVRADGVDVDAFARILRASAHGDEIARVTVEIVPFAEVSKRCGSGAEACYWRGFGRGTIVVPATPVPRRATLLHEYGHHVDSAYAVDGAPEPNGTPTWWSLRGRALLDGGQAVRSYASGWSRSIGEVFAEDYAYAHAPQPFQIPWLAPPDAALRAALLAEVGGAAAPPVAGRLVVADTVLRRHGKVAPGRRLQLPFEVGAGARGATAALTLAEPRHASTRARVELDCGPGSRRAADVGARGSGVRLQLAVGTTSCVGTVANRSETATLAYELRVVAPPG